jgi:hypothetical protein
MDTLSTDAISYALMQFSARVAIPHCKNGEGKGVLTIAKVPAHI